MLVKGGSQIHIREIHILPAFSTGMSVFGLTREILFISPIHQLPLHRRTDHLGPVRVVDIADADGASWGVVGVSGGVESAVGPGKGGDEGSEEAIVMLVDGCMEGGG